MMFKTVALLAFSASALAHPSVGKRAAHRHHHNWGTGTGGVAAPTGGFSENSTDSSMFEAGSSTAAVSVVTQTVVPVAASSTVQAVATSSASAGAFYAASSGSPVAAAIDASSSSSCSSTSTSTYTSMEYITMTVSSGTSTVAISTGNVQAFHQSSSSAAAVSVSSASSSSLSVAAGGFFQDSSSAAFGGGYTSSAAASALTTFATSVASSVATSSAAAASSSSTAASGTSSSKKGLSYNSAALTSAFADTGMSWAYNWAAAPSGSLPSGVSYVPMLWGLNSVSSWASAAASAISSGSTAALSFNEPDLSTQSNIDPVTAATNHIKYMNPLTVEVGSPAITNGAGTSPLMGIDWLNAFFTACDGNCKIDFVAFHWYSDASDTAYFEQHVTDVIAAAKAGGVSKVWLTEFGVTGGDASTFLSTVMPFLESTAEVEKYAYFMCAAPELLSGTTQNSVGNIYASTA